MNNNDQELYANKYDEISACTIEFVDDYRVAYAYLFDTTRKEIIGDVWLYNSDYTPAQAEWLYPDDAELPFRNSREFVATTPFNPVNDTAEVDFDFIRQREGTLCAVRIYLRGVIHAIVKPGSQPGWCRLASVDSPVAKRIETVEPKALLNPTIRVI